MKIASTLLITVSLLLQGSSSLKIDQQHKEQEELDTKNTFFISFSEKTADSDEQYPNSLRWDHTPEQVKQAADLIMKENDLKLNEIISQKGQRTFDNTIRPMAVLESDIQRRATQLSFYSQVSDKKEVRQAADDIQKTLGDWQSKIWMRDDLYKMIRDYKDNADKDGSYEKLDIESKKYIKTSLEGMEEVGIKLNQEQKKRYLELHHQIHELEQKCRANINSDKSKAEFKETELEGIDAIGMSKLEQVKGKPGYRYIALDKHQLGGALRLMSNSESRRKLEYQNGLKQMKENVPMIEELVVLRQELAELLQYSSYSEMILKDRMAKNITTVENFENELFHRIKAKGDKEMNVLTQFKQKLTHNSSAVMESWDLSYINMLQKQEKHEIEEEKYREYFPAENIKLATMEIYEQLLSLEFTKLPNAATWHKDVTCYEVKDKQSKDLLGHFYLDLYPRPDKFNHAAAFPLIKRFENKGEVLPAAAAMVTNFAKAEKGKPSLLAHNEIVTFFHEFGHVMHNMCSEAKYSGFAGTSVEKDFVEMPSQMLENWMWQKEILKKVSKHYKTGKPLPDDMIEAKIKSKNDFQATKTLNQIMLGTTDLLLYSASDKKQLISYKKHMSSLTQHGQEEDNISAWRTQIKHKSGKGVDTEALWHKMSENIEGNHVQEGTNPIATFGHLISGYVSQYYSYLWSKVYSDDLFAKFKKEGIMNKDIGMKYRKMILAPGGSVDSIDSLKQFLGREPNHKAFLHANGFDHE